MCSVIVKYVFETEHVPTFLLYKAGVEQLWLQQEVSAAHAPPSQGEMVPIGVKFPHFTLLFAFTGSKRVL